jgi:hypothetical protein
MSLFKRRGKDDAADETDEFDDVDAAVDADSADARGDSSPQDDAEEVAREQARAAGQAAAAARSEGGGPRDVSEVDDVSDMLDLGSVLVAPSQGMELRLELDETGEQVVGATVLMGESAVQIQAFAAPRSEGIWAEVRAEIGAGVTQQGGTADEVPGTFGRELLARVPAQTPEGRTTFQPARFVGVDGPRWFVRAVFTGPAALQPEAAVELERVVRGLVVVRGGDAMAPRELLPLRLPAMPEAQEDPDAASGDALEADGRDPLKPFERGPEITEIR